LTERSGKWQIAEVPGVPCGKRREENRQDTKDAKKKEIWKVGIENLNDSKHFPSPIHHSIKMLIIFGRNSDTAYFDGVGFMNKNIPDSKNQRHDHPPDHFHDIPLVFDIFPRIIGYYTLFFEIGKRGSCGKTTTVTA
jgi:hypothetical protein